MNYDVNKDTLSVCNLEFEGCREIPVDLDFSLPDYCPDIQKILKCRVSPNITARNISGDRLNIEGTAGIRLVYLDSESMKIRCCENSAPFSCSIDIKHAPENAVALTHVRTDYINCRAVSPRKIDIHGALSISAKIYSKNSMDISCCVNGKDIQQKIENTVSSNLVGMGQQQFSINETLEAAENKPRPEFIIRANVLATLNDYKIMPGKVVVKGEAILKFLYVDDLSTGNLETMEYSIPISQIIDVPGADENCKYVTNIEVLGHTESIQCENDEGLNNLVCEIKLAATVRAYSDKEIGVVSDIYSTEYELKSESQLLKLNTLKGMLKDNFVHKGSVDLPGSDVSKIVDVWSDSCSVKTTGRPETMEFKGKINLCILALDKENVPFYIERILEFNHDKTFEENNDNNQNIVAEVTLVPTSIGYGISNGNNVDVKIEFDMSGALYEPKTYDMITSAEADESKPHDKDAGTSLTIYYSNDGEELWDIARKYHTSVNSIKQENDISEDTAIKNRMLLIPMK